MVGSASELELPFPDEEIPVRAAIRTRMNKLSERMNKLDIESIKLTLQDILQEIEAYEHMEDDQVGARHPTLHTDSVSEVRNTNQPGIHN